MGLVWSRVFSRGFGASLGSCAFESGVFFRLSFIRIRKGERLSQPEIGFTADLSRMDFARDDTAAGATRPVHNTWSYS